MLINEKNYQKLLNAYQDENKILSEQLVKIFEHLNNGKVEIASVGNSISSGYSKCDEMLPLLMRSDLYNYDSLCDFYNFARVRRNEEYNVIKWYKSNISHQEINSLLLMDIMAKINKYACFDEKQIEAYQKMANKSNIGFSDFVKLDNNIIIYNGLTGSFTDRLRKGNLTDRLKIFSSFSEDFENLKSLLLQLYLDNPNVQIYICGIPDVLGVGISCFYDKYLKRTENLFPNVKYVKSSSRNMLLKLEGQKEFDIHFNKPEYLYLLNNIFKEILSNYIPMKIKSKILTDISLYSHENELKDTTSKGSKEKLESIIKEVYKEYEELIIKYNINFDDILDEVFIFYDKYYLVNYPCTNRNSMKTITRELKYH